MDILKKLAELIKVKSLVTISLTIGFLVLALNHVITGEQFLMIYTTIIAFYFGTQANKGNGGGENTNG